MARTIPDAEKTFFYLEPTVKEIVFKINEDKVKFIIQTRCGTLMTSNRSIGNYNIECLDMFTYHFMQLRKETVKKTEYSAKIHNK